MPTPPGGPSASPQAGRSATLPGCGVPPPRSGRSLAANRLGEAPSPGQACGNAYLSVVEGSRVRRRHPRSGESSGMALESVRGRRARFARATGLAPEQLVSFRRPQRLRGDDVVQVVEPLPGRRRGSTIQGRLDERHEGSVDKTLGVCLALPDVENPEHTGVLIEAGAVADESVGDTGRHDMVADGVVVRSASIVTNNRELLNECDGHVVRSLVGWPDRMTNPVRPDESARAAGKYGRLRQREFGYAPTNLRVARLHLRA